MEYTQYVADENKVYVHKEKEFLFGKVIIITPDDDYTIEDFLLMSKEEHSELLESQ